MSVNETNETLELQNHLNLTETEELILMDKLWQLLQVQAEKYNGCDSTSMTIEKAQDLLESLLYTIQVSMEVGVSKEELLQGSLSLCISRGREQIMKKKKAAHVDYQFLLTDIPPVTNVYYMETLRNLKLFFDRYDCYYGAHHIPCSIDYFLLCQVDESRKGVSFIEDYIRRLLIENDFVNCFAREKIQNLYSRFTPDYRNSFFNLCDPILTNALGLCIAGADARNLNVFPEHRREILERVSGMGREGVEDLIRQETIRLCRRIGLAKESHPYFIQASSGLGIRLYEAAKTGDLSYLFLSW